MKKNAIATLVIGCASLLVSCGVTPTEVVVVLRGDEIALDGARVDVVVEGASGMETLPTQTIGEVALPLEIPIVPVGGDASRVFIVNVRVTPTSGPTRVLRLRGGFVRDRLIRSDVWITPPPVCDAVTADCTVHLRGPAPGAFTGSVHAPSTGDTESPLRPHFRWDAVAGAHFELELDGTCGDVSPDLCPFVSATRVSTMEPEHLVPSALDVSLTAPVGRRYVWRVRACTSICSAWTEPRTLEVGRQRTDIDGDGYADLLIGAPNSRAGQAEGHQQGDGAVFFLAGGPDLDMLGDPELLRMGCHFGQTVAAIGDADGDGFPDFVVDAPQTRRTEDGICHSPAEAEIPTQFHGGRFHVFFGSTDGPVEGMEVPAPSMDTLSFGLGLSTAGDLDRDGLADVVVPTTGQLSFMLGREDRELVPLDGRVIVNGSEFPDTSCCTDLDGDGRGDLLATRDDGLSLVSEGELRVLAAPTTLMTNDVFSRDAGMPDLDGDGDAELIAGSCSAEFTEAFAGEIWRTVSVDEPFTPFPHAMLPTPRAGPFFGCQFSNLGDLDGDGRGDVGAGTAFFDASSGRALLFVGEREIPFTSDVDGVGVHGIGDVDGDGFDDLVLSPFRLDVDGCENGPSRCNGGALDVFLGGPDFDPRSRAADLHLVNPRPTDNSDFGSVMAEAYP